MDLLAQIATFVRVVEGKSLSTAARSQRLSLAAVSRQLRALEEDLGVTLIRRTTRSLRVTDEGERWYAHGVRILAEVEAARASVAKERAVAGRLTVSASITLGLHFVTPVIASLVAEHPRLEVDLRLEDRIADLVTDGVDVALRGGIVPPDSTAIVARPISTFVRVLVAAPAYVKRNGTPKEPADLARHCCLVQMGATGAIDEWPLRSKNEERTVRVRHRLRCNAPIALLHAARDGSGIASLGEWLVEDDLAEGRLVRVLPQWTQPPTNVWAVHRAEMRGSPRIRVLLDALTEYSSIGSTGERSPSRRARARR